MEGSVVFQRLRTPENAIIEERGVYLRLGRRSRGVQLDMRAAAAEEVAASRAGRVDCVLREDQRRRERRPAVGRLVETDLRTSRRREAAAVGRGRAVSRHVRADEDMIGVVWIDRDRTDS